MTKALLIAVVCSAAYGASITYDYTGNTFTTCTGPCPAGTYSDYIVASATFSAPLPTNLGLSNFQSSPSLIGWTFGDFDAYQFISSTDPNASSELSGLYLATNSSGAISESYFNATGGILALDDPAVTSSGTVYAGFILDGPIADGGWSALSSIPGQWTETLNGFQGGTTSAPAFLLGGSPVAGLTGTIGGQGSEDYYLFYWGGGAFSATASITGASSTASYLFTDGLAASSCSGGSSQTLNSGDSFTGTISNPSLAPGQYCIGLDANNANDPNFVLTFNTPVSATPEPSCFLLLSAGLGMIGVLRAKRGRQHS
jgi:hypothetical protein